MTRNSGNSGPSGPSVNSGPSGNSGPGTETAQSQTPLFGLAYHPLQVSSFGNLVLPSLQFGESDRFTGFM